MQTYAHTGEGAPSINTGPSSPQSNFLIIEKIIEKRDWKIRVHFYIHFRDSSGTPWPLVFKNLPHIYCLASHCPSRTLALHLGAKPICIHCYTIFPWAAALVFTTGGRGCENSEQWSIAAKEHTGEVCARLCKIAAWRGRSLIEGVSEFAGERDAASNDRLVVAYTLEYKGDIQTYLAELEQINRRVGAAAEPLREAIMGTISPEMHQTIYQRYKRAPATPTPSTTTRIARECQDSSWLQSWGAYPTHFGLTMW